MRRNRVKEASFTAFGRTTAWWPLLTKYQALENDVVHHAAIPAPVDLLVGAHRVKVLHVALGCTVI